MSNSPVDAARYPTQEQEDDDDELSSDSTHVSYRIKTDQIRFYKNKLINEPKLSSQAKAAINIAGNRFAKFEEIAYAKYVHKELAKAIGPNAPT